ERGDRHGLLPHGAMVTGLAGTGPAEAGSAPLVQVEKGLAMRMILLGDLVSSYVPGLKPKLSVPCDLVPVPDATEKSRMEELFANADAALVLAWSKALPPAPRLKLVQVSGAGYEAVDLDAVPAGATVCNAFGHEEAMGEYAVMAMLAWC